MKTFNKVAVISVLVMLDIVTVKCESEDGISEAEAAIKSAPGFKEMFNLVEANVKGSGKTPFSVSVVNRPCYPDMAFDNLIKKCSGNVTFVTFRFYDNAYFNVHFEHLNHITFKTSFFPEFVIIADTATDYYFMVDYWISCDCLMSKGCLYGVMKYNGQIISPYKIASIFLAAALVGIIIANAVCIFCPMECCLTNRCMSSKWLVASRSPGPVQTMARVDDSYYFRNAQ